MLTAIDVATTKGITLDGPADPKNGTITQATRETASAAHMTHSCFTFVPTAPIPQTTFLRPQASRTWRPPPCRHTLRPGPVKQAPLP